MKTANEGENRAGSGLTPALEPTTAPIRPPFTGRLIFTSIRAKPRA